MWERWICELAHCSFIQLKSWNHNMLLLISLRYAFDFMDRFNKEMHKKLVVSE